MNLYDEGYQSCPCFWGSNPAKLVTEAVTRIKSTSINGVKAIDFGCGEGKNVGYVAKNGISIVGIDSSKYAIEHARKTYPDLSAIFLVVDMTSVDAPEESFDLVISTGSIHCLKSEEEVSKLIATMKKIIKKGGLIVFSSFNDRKQNLDGHPPTFTPIFLSHEYYLEAFSNLEILHSSDKDLSDVHPNNHIQHFHSITRILAKKS